MRPVLRLTEPRNRTEPSISVPENQELKKNRNSRFRFGSASVFSVRSSVLGFLCPERAQEIWALALAPAQDFWSWAENYGEKRCECWVSNPGCCSATRAGGARREAGEHASALERMIRATVAVDGALNHHGINPSRRF